MSNAFFLHKPHLMTLFKVTYVYNTYLKYFITYYWNKKVFDKVIRTSFKI